MAVISANMSRAPFPILPDRKLQTLGHRLRVARRAREHTIESLSALAGVSASTVKSMEAGAPGVAIGAWLKVMDVLGLLDQVDAMLSHKGDDALVEHTVRRLSGARK
jgi:predicted transcriptional regulator